MSDHGPSDEHKRLAELDGVPPGAMVERSSDGSITSIVTDSGEWSVHVDPNTEFGAKLHSIADEQGKEASQCLREAIQEYARGEQEIG